MQNQAEPNQGQGLQGQNQRDSRDCRDKGVKNSATKVIGRRGGRHDFRVAQLA